MFCELVIVVHCLCLFFMSVLLLSSMLQLSAEELLAKGKVGVELWPGAGFEFSAGHLQLALEMQGR